MALGKVLAETSRSLRVLEPFIPPPYYLPPESVDQTLLVQRGAVHPSANGRGSYYFDVVVGEGRLSRAIWTYSNPSERFRDLAGWFALYPGLMDSCWVNDERVQPQQGGSMAVGSRPRSGTVQR